MEKSNRFLELDALRGIAAIMVVFFHFSVTTALSAMFNLGVTGVELFFMISGFVIYMSLTKAKGSLEFIINRVSRLYPTYWACVTLTFIFICIKEYTGKSADSYNPDIYDYLKNMTMFQYYVPGRDLDGVYWTLIIEMLFYIIMVLLFKVNLLKYIDLFGITTSIIMVSITSVPNCQTYARHIISVIPLFSAGIIFYKIFLLKDKLVLRYTLVLLSLISQIYLFHFRSRLIVEITQTEYAVMCSIYFILFTLLVNGKLKFAVNRITLFLGKISFSLYLIHCFLGSRVIIPALTSKYFHLNYFAAAYLITLPIVIILAYLINIYVEIPISKRMRNKLMLLADN
jgi:peptidoglycan/LPS O-acetylase OafA/YrhL